MRIRPKDQAVETEYAAGWIIRWDITSHDHPGIVRACPPDCEPIITVAYAHKSPLSGDWIVNGGSHLWEKEPTRTATLREARRIVLGGNGRRFRGHSAVSRFTVARP